MTYSDFHWFVGQDCAHHPEAYAHYSEHYAKFREATRRILNVSFGCGGVVRTHDKEHYCAALCIKLAVTARSIFLLAPNPNTEDFLQSHIDFSSSAALSRLLVNTFASLHHLGIEECSEDEFRVRELLAFWRDYRVRRKMNFSENTAEADAFHEPNLKGRLDANAHWQALPSQRRRHLLKANDLLYSEEEILRRAGVNETFHRQMYAYWSAHAHCDSVAFLEMQKNRRGTGQINAGDVAMLAVSLEYCSHFLNTAASEVDRIFVGAELRSLSIKGLDLLNNKVMPITWLGESLLGLRSKSEQ